MAIQADQDDSLKAMNNERDEFKKKEKQYLDKIEEIDQKFREASSKLSEI